VQLAVRFAEPGDEAALAALDQATWTAEVTPAPPPPPGKPFFDERTEPGDVLVAELEGAVAGYVRLGRATELRASDHVVTISGLAVDPRRQRRGVGRALVEAAVREAAARGARRLTLRVLGHNTGARALYESCGFAVEGIQRDEFLLEGRYVDDVLMALDLS
jgi:ribosomal protein S18 acetylase RimI-like enzyme